MPPKGQKRTPKKRASVTDDVAIFCFRRDLRLVDNTAWNRLLETIADTGTRIVPIFCMDPRQVSSDNKYRSLHALRFLFQSLADLHGALAPAGLTVLLGTPETCIPTLARACKARVVAWNEDVTPFARARDRRLHDALSSLHESDGLDVRVVTAVEDATVVPVRDLRTQTGKIYQVFTPFYRACVARGVAAPLPADAAPDAARARYVALSDVLPRAQWPTGLKVAPHPDRLDSLPGFAAVRNLANTSISSSTAAAAAVPSAAIATIVDGGRTAAMRRLTPVFLRRFAQYAEQRDVPYHDGTTRLSASLKFGCVSFREVYAAVMATLGPTSPRSAEALTRELFWNAFYAYIAWHCPWTLAGQLRSIKRASRKPGTSADADDADADGNGNGDGDGDGDVNGNFRRATVLNDAGIWRHPAIDPHARHDLQRWQEGRTGFPLVDAAMQQLRQTGWMHNRMRMVVASFLTKDLRIHWRDGEQHFATSLVDYDPASNNGGWQWAAATGADAQPYYRIFNPWSQSKKFDPDGRYITTFVPELTGVAAGDLHTWHDAAVRDKYATDEGVQAYGRWVAETAIVRGCPAPMVDHSNERRTTLALWKLNGTPTSAVPPHLSFHVAVTLVTLCSRVPAALTSKSKRKSAVGKKETIPLGEAVATWYRERFVDWQPSSDLPYFPQDIEIVPRGKLASTGLQLTFKLRRVSSSAKLTAMDVRHCADALANPDKEGQHPLHLINQKDVLVSGCVVR